MNPEDLLTEAGGGGGGDHIITCISGSFQDSLFAFDFQQVDCNVSSHGFL